MILGVLTGCSSSKTPAYRNLDEFAQCLTEKGVVIYGSRTCTYCQKQKDLFGESFEKINFVDCSKEPMRCDLAGVGGIPHRAFPNSTVLKGLQSLEDIAKASGCELKA